MVVVAGDLMFGVRIETALSLAGHTVRSVAPEELVQALAPGAAPGADVVVVPLGDPLVDGIAAVEAARARAPGAVILAYGPHVDTSAKERALAAGADQFVPRGSLATNPAAVIAKAAAAGASGRPPVTEQPAEIRGLMIDMDGVLWHGQRPAPDLDVLFGFLRDRQIPFVLATNNSSRRPADYVSKLAGFGVPLPSDIGDRVVTSALATAEAVAGKLGRGAGVYVVGEEGLVEALREAGLLPVTEVAPDGERKQGAPPAAVVVGFDRGLTYAKLAAATRLIRAGAWFVGTNGDVTFPAEDGLRPGAGATLAALEAATGQRPFVVGKPDAAMFEAVLARLDLPARQVAVVGDRLDTDVLGGRRAGLRTVLVTTGVDNPSSVRDSDIHPDSVVGSLAELVRTLEALVPPDLKPGLEYR